MSDNNKENVTNLDQTTNSSVSDPSAPSTVEAPKKRRVKVIIPIVAAAIVLAGAGGGYAYYDNYQKTVVIPAQKFQTATELYNSGDYKAALPIFEELGDDYGNTAKWREATEKQIELSNAYADAEELLEDEKYQEAYDAFKSLGSKGYKDALDRSKEIQKEYLSLIAQIRRAKVGDVFKIGSSDEVFSWTNEDGEKCDSTNKWTLVYKDNKEAIFAENYDGLTPYLTKKNELSNTYFSRNDEYYNTKDMVKGELADYFIDGFQADEEFYEMYVKNNDDFKTGDNYAWLIYTGTKPVMHDIIEGKNWDFWKCTYVGTDNKIKGECPGNVVISRTFVRLDISE